MTRPYKVAIVGLDAAMPSLIKKYSLEGYLPNITKLLDRGIFSESLSSFPTTTSTNWTTLATGANPRTHGVIDMAFHLPGEPLDSFHSGFHSSLCKSERIWETAEKAGKGVVLLKYPCSWPPTLKSGLQVEGFGAPSGPGKSRKDANPIEIAPSTCFSTSDLENSVLIDLKTSSDWSGIPDSEPGPLETKIDVGPDGAKIRYHILVVGLPETGYHRIMLFRSRLGNNIVAEIRVGQWSQWIKESFSIKGRLTPAFFRVKLVSLSTDASDFRLYVSQIFPHSGWTYPKELANELIEKIGPFPEYIGHWPYIFGWIDIETYMEEAERQVEWLCKATQSLLKDYKWDLFMTQWHGIDYTQHAFLRLDSSDYDSNDEMERSWGLVKWSYQLADRLVGYVADVAGENAAIMTISDHGCAIGKRRFFVNNYLYKMGFLALSEDNGRWGVNWARTKAFGQGLVHIYINVNDTCPDGIVSPGAEYDKVIEAVIDSLYGLKDPETGMRPIYLAFRRSDAEECLGLGGERAGDIIFATNPKYYVDSSLTNDLEIFRDLRTGIKGGSIHGPLLHTTNSGSRGSLHGIFIAAGPGIKAGYVRPVPIRLVDVAPTVADLLSIPAPSHSEGRLLSDMLIRDEDMVSLRKTIARLFFP